MGGIEGILESVLYASDLARAEGFYGGTLGLPIVSRDPGLFLAFRAGARSVLLVFDPGASEEAGRSVPAHGGRGPGHVALRIEAGSYGFWIERFRAAGIEVEQEHAWDTGARSIYVRDPAGNSVELITGDIWPTGARPENNTA